MLGLLVPTLFLEGRTMKVRIAHEKLLGSEATFIEMKQFFFLSFFFSSHFLKAGMDVVP